MTFPSGNEFQGYPSPYPIGAVAMIESLDNL